MGFPAIFGLARSATIAVSPSLPSFPCTTTTTIDLPAITSINNSTLTYNGPLDGSFFAPFKFTTTTFTTVIPTRGADGVIDSQTYTIIGAPWEGPTSFPVDLTGISLGTTSAVQSQPTGLFPSSIVVEPPSPSLGSEVRLSKMHTCIS
jgi:hypothetical protein